MKKLAVLALLVILALNQSQAKTTSVERVMASQKRSALRNQTLMKNVLVLAVPRAQRRLLASNNDNDSAPGPDELDLQSPYARNRVHDKRKVVDDDLSDYVKVRLAVARAKALEKYREQWA